MSVCDECDMGMQIEGICEICKNADRYRKALVEIDAWSDAYPLKVFPEPDLKKAAEVLKTAGLTLDSLSASAMRHVLKGVKNITEQALKDGQEGS